MIKIVYVALVFMKFSLVFVGLLPSKCSIVDLCRSVQVLLPLMFSQSLCNSCHMVCPWQLTENQNICTGKKKNLNYSAVKTKYVIGPGTWGS